MTGYVDLGEQVDKDFHRALLKASLRRWKSRLRGNNRHERLLSFEEIHRAAAATSRYAPYPVTPWNSGAVTDEPS
jgi:hypothetical protein